MTKATRYMSPYQRMGSQGTISGCIHEGYWIYASMRLSLMPLHLFHDLPLHLVEVQGDHVLRRPRFPASAVAFDHRAGEKRSAHDDLRTDVKVKRVMKGDQALLAKLDCPQGLGLLRPRLRKRRCIQWSAGDAPPAGSCFISASSSTARLAMAATSRSSRSIWSLSR